MTIWQGHTTRASRGQRSIPCPTCGTPRYTPLTLRVQRWLSANPSECLTYAQIVEQFGTPMSTARWAMTKACREGKIRKRASPTNARRVEFFSARWAA